WRDLEAFVAACRNPAGEPVLEEHVLDLLVDEHRTTRHISAAARTNRTPLRLCTTWHGLTFRVGTAQATLVTTAAHRDRLRAELAHQQPPGDAQWWQLWPGESGWEDLTPRPADPIT